MAGILGTLVEAPGRFQRYMDGCTCGRADKAAVTAIKMELEAKDGAIERLEEEIRRKDTEKDNLIHMQKDLQAQIEEIRRVLEQHANESMNKGVPVSAEPEAEDMADDKAALLMQTRARGIKSRKDVAEKRAQVKSAQMMQARARGINTRKMMDQKKADGSIMDLPGAKRMAEQGQPIAVGRAIDSMPYDAPPEIKQHQQQATGGATSVLPAEEDAYGDEDPYEEDDYVMGPPPSGTLGAGLQGGGGGFDEERDESVDSDYDYGESAFAELGLELLSGRLKLAKVYGQEEPPAAEDELEWETRYFVLFDTRKMCHFDDMQDGLPVGDRGLISLDNVTSVEKVLGVPTFVMKSTNKVYLFKLDPHDEVMMRTWIGAISTELNLDPRRGGA